VNLPGGEGKEITPWNQKPSLCLHHPWGTAGVCADVALESSGADSSVLTAGVPQNYDGNKWFGHSERHLVVVGGVADRG
jgi:hypothetical protein